MKSWGGEDKLTHTIEDGGERMIDVLDLVTYLHREGKITAFRDRAKDIQITCPYTHYKYDEATGKTYPYKERRPSLGISVEPPYFYNCFSCGAKGTVEFLVADILEISLSKRLGG